MVGHQYLFDEEIGEKIECTATRTDFLKELKFGFRGYEFCAVERRNKSGDRGSFCNE